MSCFSCIGLQHAEGAMQRPRRQRKAIAVLAKLCAVALLHASAGHAATVSLHTDDGLAAQAEGTTLTVMTLDGHAIPEMGVDLAVIDPRSGQNAAGFNVEARWTSERGCLRLEGEVRVPCGEDTVADLVIRVRGVDLPASRIAENPLLLPARLVSKLPLVSLRAGGKDSLALAVPPDRLAIYRFANTAEGAELRFPFGFTKDAKPELRLRAPFACVIYRSDPKWHFRSALQQYYRLFREPFTPFIRKGGGWFFAAPTTDLPNPQHFYYYEGGPHGDGAARTRGLGTFPYRESSSLTVSLPGTELPKDYAIIRTVYKALDESGNEIGITAGVVTKGFNSGLNITIGIGTDGAIHGVIVGDNTETAGLGAKAAEPEYEGQYVGKMSPLTVVKASPGDSEIEAITGATITSRAVTDAVNTVGEFYAALTGGAK